MTPRGYLTSVTKTLRYLAKSGDTKAFYAYVDGEAFHRALIALAPKRRRSVMRAYVAAAGSCESRSRQPLLKPRTKLGQAGGAPKWTNPVMQAKLSNAYARAGTDEGAARILGVTPGSARLAKRRYLDAPATVAHAQAA